MVFSPLLHSSNPALPSPAPRYFYEGHLGTLFIAGLAIQSLVITKIIIVGISVLKLVKENVPSEGLKQLAHVVQEVFLYPVAIKSARISDYI